MYQNEMPVYVSTYVCVLVLERSCYLSLYINLNPRTYLYIHISIHISLDVHVHSVVRESLPCDGGWGTNTHPPLLGLL